MEHRASVFANTLHNVHTWTRLPNVVRLRGTPLLSNARLYSEHFCMHLRSYYED